MKLIKPVCIIVAFILIGALQVLGQSGTGIVSGTIVDKQTGDPMIGAVIKTLDGSSGTTTDIDGKFILKVHSGSHTIVCNYISYAEHKVEVNVKAGEVLTLNAALEETSVTMNEVVVTYTLQKSSAVAQMIERKNAAVVSDGISSEMIKKTPDRSASDALKRVTGASIQEGRFAIIRGMNDRYNAGYLDGASLPSTESDRKAFAFDVIPSSLIDKLQVIKAGTPDISGDFGGGLIKINTKAIPEKFTHQLSIGAQSHSLTTFKTFDAFSKYSGEGLGFISSKRDLPPLEENAMRIKGQFATEEERVNLAQNSTAFNTNWNRLNSQADPNLRLSYSMGYPILVNERHKLGLVFAINYANTRKYSTADIQTYDGSGQVSDLQDRQFGQNIGTGGILNLNYTSDNTQISFNNFYNLISDFNTIYRKGIGNLIDYVQVDNRVNIVTNNQLLNSVLNYRRVFSESGIHLDAAMHYSQVNRSIPTYQIVSYTKNTETPDYTLALGDFFNSSSGLFNSQLDEDLAAGHIHISKKVENNRFPFEVKAGFSFQRRARDFESRNFVYGGTPGELTYDPAIDLGTQNIGKDGLYLLEKTANDLAYYNGEQSVMGGFAMMDQRFGNLRALYGMRYERSDIEIRNDHEGMDIASIQQGNVLPSLNLTYAVNPQCNLRAAYFSSINRPEFRELAPFAFYAFDKNAEVRGNKDLKIATLNNFEIRGEWFPTGGQVISAGAFYKRINNPIEFNIDITQAFTTFTFGNEKAASIFGAEFELRKNLDFFGEQNIFKELSLNANIAWIHSKLEFSEGSQSANNRPLQGQSPFVFNGGLQYESESNGWSFSLVGNRIGRRIAYVGVDPKFGETRMDIYEDSRTVIDLQAGKTIGKFNMKLTIGDLFKHDQIFYQDANLSGDYEENEDRRIFRFKNGLTTSLSVNYSF